MYDNIDARKLTMPVFAVITAFLVILPGVGAWTWSQFEISANSEKIKELKKEYGEEIEELENKIISNNRKLSTAHTDRLLVQQSLAQAQRTIDILNAKMDKLLGLPVVGSFLREDDK